jgi:phage tail sheath gpL-like
MAGVASNYILPFVGVDIDASLASGGAALMPFQGLIIGQKVAGGTLDQAVVQQVFSSEGVETLAGYNSMAAAMARKWFKNAQYVDTFLVLLDDAATSTAATRVLTITGPATADGTLTLLFNGVRVSVAVSDEDTATEIGDNLVAALLDYNYLQFVGVNVTGTVTFTASNKGVAAGEALGDMRVDPDPTVELPAGVGASFAATTPGTVDPDLQDVIDVLGDEKFNVIANPYADDTNLDLLETYLELQYGAMYMRDGLCYQAMRGSVSTQTTFSTGANRNCPHAVLIDGENRQAAMYELTAAYAGAVAKSAQEDSGNPLHYIKLVDIRPNISSERWIGTERNTLARNGVATLLDGNGVQTEATVTMYLKNSAGAADIAYQYQNTLYILGYARWDLVNGIRSRYPRARLAKSSEGFAAGIKVVTESVMKTEVMGWFQKMQYMGLFEDISQFQDELVIGIDTNNVNRINIQCSPNIVNQLITTSGVISYRL